MRAGWRATRGQIRRRHAGFTATEIVASLSAASVLAAIGVISLGTLSAVFSLDHGTRTVAMALSQARVNAISRGHVVTVTFGSSNFVARDTEVGDQGEIFLEGSVPHPVTMEASGQATFSALGTVANPVTVTLTRGGSTRQVQVALTGAVEIVP